MFKWRVNMPVDGMTKVRRLEKSRRDRRSVNVVATRHLRIRYAQRFTSTDENKAALVSTVPSNALFPKRRRSLPYVFVASANALVYDGASIPVEWREAGCLRVVWKATCGEPARGHCRKVSEGEKQIKIRYLNQ